MQLSYDYEVTLAYQEHTPASIDDVVVDSAAWDPSTIIGKACPKELTIITKDVNAFQAKMSEILDVLISTYEGFFGWSTSTLSFEKLSSDIVCQLSYAYIAPAQELRQMQNKSAFATKNVWRSILNRAQVPAFVKPFLAISYLSQECCYDQRAYDEVEDDPTRIPTDPIPHLAYGPLVEKRGICDGLAWAFKRLMDEAKVECVCVSGFLKKEKKVGHLWNLVKLDGQFYHVDPTWGIKNEGVYVTGLLQPDSMMRNTHIWDTTKYPAARGIRLSYEYIEEYLAENGGEYLDAGAAEKYMFPDDIVE